MNDSSAVTSTVMLTEPPSSRKCSFTSCDQPVTSRYPGAEIPICQQHVALVWSCVQSEVLTPNATAIRRRRRPNLDPGHPGWVYFVLLGDHIKIGYARDLELRLNEYPPTATLLAACPGTLQNERELHDRFVLHRVAGREWYSKADEIIEHIRDVVVEHGSPELDPFEVKRLRKFETKFYRNSRLAKRKAILPRNSTETPEPAA